MRRRVLASISFGEVGHELDCLLPLLAISMDNLALAVDIMALYRLTPTMNKLDLPIALANLSLSWCR